MKMTTFRSDLTDISTKKESIGLHHSTVKFFSKLNNLFSGYFDPGNILLDNKNELFLGWPKRYFG